MSKLSKLLSNPGLFFRDYFINRYPLSLDEQGHDVFNEGILVASDFKIYNIDINQNTDDVDVVITWVNNEDHTR